MLTQKDILLNSSLTISYPQNTKSYSLYTTKIICFLFFIFSVLVPVQSICNPSDTGDTTKLDVMFCNPKGGEEYEIGQIVVLSWNPVNAYLFSGSGQVQVYLFRMRQNATGDEDVIPLNPGESKEFLMIPRSSNSINFTVELGWLPTFKYSIPFQKHTFEFRVIPFGSSDKFDRSFSTPSFVVIQPDDSSSSSPTANNEKSTFKTEAQANPTVTVTTPILDSNQENNSGNKVLIVVIAVAGIAAFLAFMAIVIATCGRKRNKNPTMLKSQSNLSTSSSTPMITSLSIGKFGSNNRDSESPIEAESIHSTTPLSNKEEMRSKPKISFSSEHQPISASDAALLSDAFRTVLRKPDWKPEDEDEDEVNLSNEELLRRRGAKERMEKELAEEGTDLQNISKRHTKVEIHNTDEELENGSGHSSESGSKQ